MEYALKWGTNKRCEKNCGDPISLDKQLNFQDLWKTSRNISDEISTKTILQVDFFKIKTQRNENSFHRNMMVCRNQSQIRLMIFWQN